MASTVERWERLEKIRGLLLAGELTTARQFAEAVGVSLRTVVRDLNVLRDSGVLIEADPGRGGGVRIAAGHGAGRVSLASDEALDMLIAVAVAEKLGSPSAPNGFRFIRHKLNRLLAPSHREGIQLLRQRILVGGAASPRIASEFDLRKARHNHTLRQAFIERRSLELVYRDRSGERTVRTADPQYLLLNPPAWYVLAWDRLREGIRAFRVDRVAGARILQERFSMRPAARFLEAVEAGVERL